MDNKRLRINVLFVKPFRTRIIWSENGQMYVQLSYRVLFINVAKYLTVSTCRMKTERYMHKQMFKKNIYSLLFSAMVIKKVMYISHYIDSDNNLINRLNGKFPLLQQYCLCVTKCIWKCYSLDVRIKYKTKIYCTTLSSNF